MKGSSLKLPRLLLPLGSLVFCISLMATPILRYQDIQQPAPDNTKKNTNQTSPTADQQKMNASDRTITQTIRKAIHENQSFSTYAHNIKVITQDGKVTLRGPVRSEEENLQAKAVAVAGHNQSTRSRTFEIAEQKSKQM